MLFMGDQRSNAEILAVTSMRTLDPRIIMEVVALKLERFNLQDVNNALADQL